MWDICHKSAKDVTIDDLIPSDIVESSTVGQGLVSVISGLLPADAPNDMLVTLLAHSIANSRWVSIRESDILVSDGEGSERLLKCCWSLSSEDSSLDLQLRVAIPMEYK